MDTDATANAAHARMRAAPSAGDVACHGESKSAPNNATHASCELAMNREVSVAGATDTSFIEVSREPYRMRVPMRPHRISVRNGRGRSVSSPLRYE